ncbi:MAG: AAA family ATPase [Prevotella sp.]|nr:AAA family ATPase [Prevotella sp.]
MSQRLEITNFGPVKRASIEIKPALILIGQQASGKSTVAKLIYFFQSLSSEFFSRYYQSSNEGVEITEDLIIPIREKFYDFFGSTFHLPNFEIVYHYEDNRYLSLSLTPKKKINAHFSESFFTKKDFQELRGYKKMLLQLKTELANIDNVAKKVALDERHLNYLHQLADKINALFCNVHNDSLFILAGRNATIGYSETFENMLQQSIQKNIEEQGHRAFEAKEQTVDETLMLSFMQRVVKMRQSFINLGNFEGMITHANGRLKPRLKLANKLIREVLRGQYSNSEFGERIVHPGQGYVYLKNASSGQQESIRILQDAFLSIYQSNKLLRIVEEPEAHLFPEAQMATIQLLVLMLNSAPAGHLILTTHSPYTLTVINNLIYAAKVGVKYPDQVNSIIRKELWLPLENVSAYILQNGEASDIIDAELGEIKAELIDGISNVINNQYDQLLQLDDSDGTED